MVDIKLAWHNFRLKINFVVQKDNYREMPAFIMLGKKYDCDIVAFARILNRGTFKDREYIRLAVHEPGNRAHKKFKKLLDQPIFNDPIVKLRNLSNLVEKA